MEFRPRTALSRELLSVCNLAGKFLRDYSKRNLGTLIDHIVFKAPGVISCPISAFPSGTFEITPAANREYDFSDTYLNDYPNFYQHEGRKSCFVANE